jgi:riboflavin kinase/FMN adenylyltransferase
MNVYNIKDLDFNFKNSVLTIGSFDGIHLGHKKLMELTKEAALKFNSVSIVLTFYPHPLKVLKPERKIHLITTFDKKIELIRHIGIDYLIYINFTPEFSKMTPEDFIKDVIYSKLKPLRIIVGHDFSFGNGKTGNTSLLEKLAVELGFDLIVVSPVKVDGQIVSSTLIRKLVLSGDVSLVKNFLSRYYSVHGNVIKGSGRGKLIGYPTANIIPEEELFPKDGVYASIVKIDNKIYNAVSNTGSNPTFLNESRRIESYIFNYNDDLYNKDIEVFFIKRLRDEIKFDSVNSLKAKIKEDVDIAALIHKTIEFRENYS